MNAPAAALRVLLPAEVKLDGGLPAGEVLSCGEHCMGTGWNVRFVGRDAAQALELEAALARLLENIEAQMSHFRSSSPLSRFGELPAGVVMELPPEFARVMRAALEVARLSEGAFDPTLAASVEAWGFGAGPGFRDAGFAPPPQAPAASAGWRELVLDGADRLRQPGGVRLNLAAIAKGFAVDALSARLTELGLVHHLVEVGGELRGSGMKPDGQPWWVALELPAAQCPLAATRIALHGLAVATSGAYRRSYAHQGRSLQHTLDPRSGAPVAHRLASVSVLHAECMLADAWATALMVLGPQDGLALAEAQGLCALLQWQDESSQWCEAASTAFERMQA